MKRGLVRSSRYSPSNMDRESLENLFVGRQKTMQDVIDRVTHSVESPDKHYILLVGPRGSGKTHFVALAYHRILDRLSAKGLNSKAIIALLNEEEWGVASYLDFLVRILRALANESPHLESRMAEIYNKFSHDPVEAEAIAEALLRKHTEGKTLLLICENLVDLFQGLSEVGQKRWRAFIQESGFLGYRGHHASVVHSAFIAKTSILWILHNSQVREDRSKHRVGIVGQKSGS